MLGRFLEKLEHDAIEAGGCRRKLGSLLLDTIESSEFRKYIRKQVLDVASGSADPLRSLGGNSLRLLDLPNMSITAAVVHHPTPALHTVAADRLVAFTRESLAEVTRFQIDTTNPVTDLMAGTPLVRLDTIRCNGQVVEEVQGGPLVYDYVAPTKQICLKLTLLPPDDIVWNFDRKTLLSTFPAMTHSQSSGLVLLCKLLGLLDSGGVHRWLDELSKHQSHVVRWSAIQAVGRVDREQAITYLLSALNDPHAQIRSGAADALRKAGVR